MNFELTINGNTVAVEVEPQMPLLWVLRDELNMTGTKYGCGVASCGACSVILDGVAVRTCTLPVSNAVGKDIKTIEGVSKEGQLSAVQEAWIEKQVPQCGYCQSGMIIAAEALLESNPDPTEEDIHKAMTNICRCGTYQRVGEAIELAAEKRKQENDLLGMLNR